MKHFIIIFLLSFISTAVLSQGIVFEEGTFTEALEKAKKQDKILFLDAFTTWCGPCKMMSRDVFPQAAVGEFFNEHFISIKIDMEKGEGIGLRETYNVNSFPTLLFIDSDGKELHKLIGGMYAEDLIKGAKNVVDPNTRLPALTLQYESGKRDINFLLKFINVLHGARENEMAQKVSKELVDLAPISSFDNKEMFQVLDLAKIKYGSSNYEYLVNMEQKLIPLVGSELYFQVLDGAIKNYLYEKAENSDTTLEELNAAILETRQDRAIEFFQNRMENDLRYSYYLANNDYEGWFDKKIEEADKLKGTMEYVHFIHDFGSEVATNPKFENSKNSYERALKIGHEIVEKDGGVIMGSFLLAKLYLKLENKEQALKYFNMFFDNNEAAGGNVTHVSVTDLKKEIDSL